jgi:hypothetical protein
MVGRKALRRVECKTRQVMIEHVSRFIKAYNENPTPFNWRFTKADLAKKMEKWQDPIPN